MIVFGNQPKALAIAALSAFLMFAVTARGEGAGARATSDANNSVPADWPMFIGNGNRTPPKQGIALIDDLNAMHKVWELGHHTSVGKGLYPGTLRAARAMGIEPFYGGAASPIVADGTIFLSYYKPDGVVPAAIEPWRTVSDPKSLLPPWFFSVTADDILLAVNAHTGKVKWEKIEKGVGLNRLGHKRAHWCVSPAYADGLVFSMGTVGVVRAYDAKSGERLWERPTSPDLEALKKEYLQSRKLCWKAQEGSSLVVADGVVVVARRWLMGIDAETGEQRWHIKETVQSRWGTPTLWRHEGRTCVLANSEQGDLRLIDPQDGRVLWHIDGLGPNLGTLSPDGDVVIVNVGSRHGEGKKQPGLYGAFRLKRDGAERLWTLPNTERYRHTWWPDSGAFKRMAVRDGRAWIMVQRPKDTNDQPSPPALLVVLEMETGKILSEQEVDGHNRYPYILEDRMLVYHDRAHSHPVTASWWTADVQPRRLNAEIAFGFYTITGYQVPIQWPYVDGYLYCRSLKGLVCYDLRQPAATDNARTLQFNIPAALTGRREDLSVTLYERDGRLTHGGFSGGRFLYDVDVSAVRWDGKRLEGTLGIDVESNEKLEAYGVEASLGKTGALAGTITTGVPAFGKSIAVSGSAKAIERQANWMPECTHVLWLNDAVCNADRSRQPLMLFLTVEGGRLARVEGFAPRTTKARPAVDGRALQLDDDRLTGKVTVRFRPDPWSTPLAEQGVSAAAEYRLDCKLVAAGEAGSFTGTYGVAWSRTGRLAGTIASMAAAAHAAVKTDR